MKINKIIDFFILCTIISVVVVMIMLCINNFTMIFNGKILLVSFGIAFISCILGILFCIVEMFNKRRNKNENY